MLDSASTPIEQSLLRLRHRLLRLYLGCGTVGVGLVGLALVGRGYAWSSLAVGFGTAIGAASTLAVGRVLPCRAATLGTVGLLVAFAGIAVATGGTSSPFLTCAIVLPCVTVLLGGTATARPSLLATAIFLGAVWAIPEAPSALAPGGMTQMLDVAVAAFVAFLVGVSAWSSRRVSHGSLVRLESLNADLANEVAQHHLTRKHLDQTHHEMVQTARRAGMGEVATGVLHNAGNALNALNTSVGVALGQLQSSDDRLARAAALLRAGPLSDDKLGKLASFVDGVGVAGEQRRQRLIQELQRVRKATDHLAAIVDAQQQLARAGSLVERVAATELVEQARLLVDASFSRHDVTLDVDVDADVWFTVDRHAVVQVLTNLLGNAKDALREHDGRRHIRVLGRQLDQMVQFDVVDTGPGVPEPLRNSVFTHGFTTKVDGHGFGLHASALAAQEMGGALELLLSTSGAHFRLQVPLEPPPTAAVATPVASSAADFADSDGQCSRLTLSGGQSEDQYDEQPLGESRQQRAQ